MNTIKKLALFLFLYMSFTSCLPEDDGPTYHLELLKIESVVIPDTLILGETHSLKISYKRPTSCHSFNDFYYEKYLNQRTIAVQSIVAEQSNCVPLTDQIVEVNLDFIATNNGSYIFKFWQGKDANGEDIFLEIEVPVQD